MLRRMTLVLFVVVLGLAVAVPVAFAAPGDEGRRAGGGVVYVRSQGLYYDTFVTVDPLPFRENAAFQKLEMGPHGSETDFGPGDPGYVGGRWWMDTNENGIMDAGDHYFLCPLLGPGHENP